MITCIHYQQVIRTYVCAYNYYVMYNNDHSYINRYVRSYVYHVIVMYMKPKIKKINVTNKLTEMNRPRSISYVYMLKFLPIMLLSIAQKIMPHYAQ